MKLIINASTLSSFGPVQVAVSFINECINIPDNDYHVFVSLSVSRNLEKEKFPSNFSFYLIEKHPIRPFKGWIFRNRMINLERQISPDCVFSVFGPSCWRPKAPHLIGFAYGHYIYPDSPIFSIMSFSEKIKRNVLRVFHVFFLKRDGDYYICETVDVAMRLSSFLKITQENIFCVENVCSDFFLKFKAGVHEPFLPLNHSSEFRFLSPCTPLRHKNLEILNKVVPILQKLDLNIRFVMTIDRKSYDAIFSDEVKEYIYNVGPLKAEECPQIYSECDALFLPTLLECFTANYPESMFMHKPILTSDLSFAVSICKDAALFFDPLNEYDIVRKITKIVTDRELYSNLIEKGKKRFTQFCTSRERAEKYLSICRKISGLQNKDLC